MATFKPNQRVRVKDIDTVKHRFRGREAIFQRYEKARDLLEKLFGTDCVIKIIGDPSDKEIRGPSDDLEPISDSDGNVDRIKDRNNPIEWDESLWNPSMIVEETKEKA